MTIPNSLDGAYDTNTPTPGAAVSSFQIKQNLDALCGMHSVATASGPLDEATSVSVDVRTSFPYTLESESHGRTPAQLQGDIREFPVDLTDPTQNTDQIKLTITTTANPTGDTQQVTLTPSSMAAVTLQEIVDDINTAFGETVAYAQTLDSSGHGTLLLKSSNTARGVDATNNFVRVEVNDTASRDAKERVLGLTTRIDDSGNSPPSFPYTVTGTDLLDGAWLTAYSDGLGVTEADQSPSSVIDFANASRRVFVKRPRPAMFEIPFHSGNGNTNNRSMINFVFQDSHLSEQTVALNQSSDYSTSGFSTQWSFYNTGSSAVVHVASQNLLEWSESFSKPEWAAANVTVTENQVVAPDGTLTADRLDWTSTVGSLIQYPEGNASGTSPVLLSQAYTFSAWLRAEPGVTNNVRLVALEQDSGLPVDVLDSKDIVPTEEWRRYSITGVSPASYTAEEDRFRVGFQSPDGVAFSCYVWGAQLELHQGQPGPYSVRFDSSTQVVSQRMVAKTTNSAEDDPSSDIANTANIEIEPPTGDFAYTDATPVVFAGAMRSGLGFRANEGAVGPLTDRSFDNSTSEVYDYGKLQAQYEGTYTYLGGYWDNFFVRNDNPWAASARMNDVSHSLAGNGYWGIGLWGPHVDSYTLLKRDYQEPGIVGIFPGEIRVDRLTGIPWGWSIKRHDLSDLGLDEGDRVWQPGDFKDPSRGGTGRTRVWRRAVPGAYRHVRYLEDLEAYGLNATRDFDGVFGKTVSDDPNIANVHLGYYPNDYLGGRQHLDSAAVVELRPALDDRWPSNQSGKHNVHGEAFSLSGTATTDGTYSGINLSPAGHNGVMRSASLDVSRDVVRWDDFAYTASVGSLLNAQTNQQQRQPNGSYGQAWSGDSGWKLQNSKSVTEIFNLFASSTAFDNAAWTTASGASVASNTQSSPDGLFTTADTVTFTSDSSRLSQTLDNVLSDHTVMESGKVYTITVWAYETADTGAVLRCRQENGNWQTSDLNLTYDRHVFQVLGDGTSTYIEFSVDIATDVVMFGPQLQQTEEVLPHSQTNGVGEQRDSKCVEVAPSEGAALQYGIYESDILTDDMVVCAEVSKKEAVQDPNSDAAQVGVVARANGTPGNAYYRATINEKGLLSLVRHNNTSTAIATKTVDPPLIAARGMVIRLVTKNLGDEIVKCEVYWPSSFDPARWEDETPAIVHYDDSSDAVRDRSNKHTGIVGAPNVSDNKTVQVHRYMAMDLETTKQHGGLPGVDASRLRNTITAVKVTNSSDLTSTGNKELLPQSILPDPGSAVQEDFDGVIMDATPDYPLTIVAGKGLRGIQATKKRSIILEAINDSSQVEIWTNTSGGTIGANEVVLLDDENPGGFTQSGWHVKTPKVIGVTIASSNNGDPVGIVRKGFTQAYYRPTHGTNNLYPGNGLIAAGDAVGQCWSVGPTDEVPQDVWNSSGAAFQSWGRPYGCFGKYVGPAALPQSVELVDVYLYGDVGQGMTTKVTTVGIDTFDYTINGMGGQPLVYDIPTWVAQDYYATHEFDASDVSIFFEQLPLLSVDLVVEFDVLWEGETVDNYQDREIVVQFFKKNSIGSYSAPLVQVALANEDGDGTVRGHIPVTVPTFDLDDPTHSAMGSGIVYTSFVRYPKLVSPANRNNYGAASNISLELVGWTC